MPFVFSLKEVDRAIIAFRFGYIDANSRARLVIGVPGGEFGGPGLGGGE